MRVTITLEIQDPEIAGSSADDAVRFRKRVQNALAHAWPYAPTDALKVTRVMFDSSTPIRAGRNPAIIGCSCSSGLAGGPCTLECEAPCWKRF